jgi:hypothetical protein
MKARWPALAEPQRAQRLVYRLGGADKIAFALGTLTNHLEGPEGPAEPPWPLSFMAPLWRLSASSVPTGA